METEFMDINLYIDHTLFKYDRESKALFQAGNRENQLPLAQIIPQAGFYYLKYNKATCKLSAPGLNIDIPTNDHIKVVLPEAIFCADDAACSVFNKYSRDEKCNFFLADKAVMRRLGGRLPEIEIDYVPFIVDLKFNELRHTLEPSIRLDLKDFHPIEGDRFYQAYFNKETQMIVDPQKEKGNLNDIYLLQIPNELGLDPVYMAQKAGRKDTALLLQYPIEEKLKGKLTPLTFFRAKKDTTMRAKKDTKDRQRSAKRKPGR